MSVKGNIKRTIRSNYNPNAVYSQYSPSLDARMSELEKEYGDTEYWKEFLANPYLNVPSSIDLSKVRMGDAVWTQEFLNQYEQSAMTGIEQIISRIREEARNEESAQVGRMQLAGINPDLNGVQPSQASEATELPQPELPSPTQFEQMKYERAVQGSNLGVSFLQSFLGLAEGVVGLKNSSLQNGALELQLIPQAQELLFDTIAKKIPMPEDESGEKSLSSFMAAFRGELADEENYSMLPYSRKTRKFLHKVMGQLNTNNSAYLNNKAEKLYNELVTNRWSRTKGMAHPLWDNDAEEMISKVSEGMSNIEYDNWKLQQELQNKVNQFRLNYQNEAIRLGNDVAQAGLENAQISNATSYAQQLAIEGVPEESARQERRQLELQKLQYEIEKARKEAIEAAEQEFRQIQVRYLSGDKWYHALGRLILPAIRQFVTQSTNAYFSSLGSQLASFSGPQPPAPVHNTYDTGGHFTTINQAQPNPYASPF